MLDIHKGEMSVEDICSLHQYPGPGTDDYNLLFNIYTILKKKEAAGTLLKEEPSIKSSDGSFNLDNYLRQKVWWHSGPDRYYMMEDDLKYMSQLLTDGENTLKETVTAYEDSISELKQDFERRLDRIKAANSLIVRDVLVFTAVTISSMVYLFYRNALSP
jgi:hypothetical protein